MKKSELLLVKICKKILQKKKLDSRQYFLEIHVVDHCNLKCEGCSHYSPVADEWFISLEEYEQQMRMAAPFFSGEISEFHILGGEPLLHPEIAKIVKITRKYFKDDCIKLITNGCNIKKLDESFWIEVAKANILLSITQYPCVSDFDSLIEYVKEKNVQVEIYAVKDDFSYRRVSPKGKFDWKKAYYKCPQGGHCLQLKDGKIYPCAAAAYFYILNNKYGTNFSVDKESYLELSKVKNSDEIKKFRRTSKKVCRYCNVNGRDLHPWRISKFERGEWIMDE